MMIVTLWCINSATATVLCWRPFMSLWRQSVLLVVQVRIVLFRWMITSWQRGVLLD